VKNQRTRGEKGERSINEALVQEETTTIERYPTDLSISIPDKWWTR
jgi:hypothetical protein